MPTLILLSNIYCGGRMQSMQFPITTVDTALRRRCSRIKGWISLITPSSINSTISTVRMGLTSSTLPIPTNCFLAVWTHNLGKIHETSKDSHNIHNLVPKLCTLKCFSPWTFLYDHFTTSRFYMERAKWSFYMTIVTTFRASDFLDIGLVAEPIIQLHAAAKFRDWKFD